MADIEPGAQSGRLMLLEILDPAGNGDTFIPVGCAQENSMTMENGEVDVSCKDSEWRGLATGGTRMLNTSVNGIYKNKSATAGRFLEIALGNEIETMRVTFADGEMFEGPMQIGSYGRTGNHQQATTFTCDLKSAGEMKYTPPTTGG